MHQKTLGHSKKFHNRTERLLRTAGFQILHSDYQKRGPHIIASAQGYKVLVQCMFSQKPSTFRQLDDLIDEYSTKVRKSRAAAAILALGNYDLPKRFQTYEQRWKIIRQDKVAIWDNYTIDYFGQTARALTKFAKFSILRELGVQKAFDGPLKVSAHLIQEKKRKFAFFKISPHDLIPRAYVFRREVSSSAYQRMLSKKRLDDIAEFVKRGGSFPTNIVCAFAPGARYLKRSGQLLIPSRFGAVWIIDGQHRLFSFTRMPPDFPFELPCIGFNASGLSNLSISRQADLFVKVNQEAVKIPRLLLLDLYEMIGFRHRGVEIVKELSKRLPFVGRIQVVGASYRPISLPSFALTPTMTQLVEEGGIMNKWYPNVKGDKLQKTSSNILRRYFTEISRILRKQWTSPGRYVICTNRGIRALLRLLENVLDYSNGLRNEKLVRRCLKPLKTFDFRESQLKRKYLGEAGADEFADDLIRHIKGTHPDFGPQPKIVNENTIFPGEHDKAQNLLESVFKQFEGDVIGELMFVDKSTFQYLKKIPSECGIRLLVHGAKDPAHMRSVGEGRPYVEIRKIVYPNPSHPGQERSFIHERWLSDTKRQVEVGTDLKADALGKSQHRIKVIEPAKYSPSYMSFLEVWEASDSDLEARYGKGTHSKVLFTS